MSSDAYLHCAELIVKLSEHSEHSSVKLHAGVRTLASGRAPDMAEKIGLAKRTEAASAGLDPYLGSTRW